VRRRNGGLHSLHELHGDGHRQEEGRSCGERGANSNPVPACMAAGSHLLLPPAPPDTARMKGSRWPPAHHSCLPSSTRKGSPALEKHQRAPSAARRRLIRFTWSTDLVTSRGRHRTRRGRRPPSRHEASDNSNCAYELLDEMPFPWQASYCATALISPSFSANTDVSSAHLNSDLTFTMLTDN
jgi:hypothetical protein